MLQMLPVMKTGFSLWFLLISQVQANVVCTWRNSTTIAYINCNDGCCIGMSTSPQAACCPNTSWNSLVVPICVVIGICLLAVCLVYFRPLLKQCLCGCKCPCGYRARVTSIRPTHVNTNPVYINNDDLPDYDTVSKEPRPKDLTPPPYTFVAEHPTDFGIGPRVPSAPPQYRSRCNSTATPGPITSVES